MRPSITFVDLITMTNGVLALTQVHFSSFSYSRSPYRPVSILRRERHVDPQAITEEVGTTLVNVRDVGCRGHARLTAHTFVYFAGYINAQYRFILKPTGDYTVHFADRKSSIHTIVQAMSLKHCYDVSADIYFHWPDVLQVIVPTSSVLLAAAHTFEGPSTSADSLTPQCPICLSEPVAPRMTKCGHIFCRSRPLHRARITALTEQNGVQATLVCCTTSNWRMLARKKRGAVRYVSIPCAGGTSRASNGSIPHQQHRRAQVRKLPAKKRRRKEPISQCG